MKLSAHLLPAVPLDQLRSVRSPVWTARIGLLVLIALPTMATCNDTMWSFTSGTLTLDATDTFGRRLGYVGEPIDLGPVEAAPSTPPADIEVLDPQTALRVFASAGEREDLLLRLSSTVRGVSVSDVAATSPVSIDGGDFLPEPVRFVVGELRGLDGDEPMSESWPDPLFPFDDVGRPYVSPGGLRVALTVHVPRTARPGEYRSTISISISDGRRIDLPLEITVWDLVLPESGRIATQLFALDERSIAYRYGENSGSHALQAILDDAVSMMAEHRFSTASFATGAGSRALKTKGSLASSDSPGERAAVEMIGPAFETLGNSFRLTFDLRAAAGDEGDILSHRWHRREAGYSISLGAGFLTFDAGIDASSEDRGERTDDDSLSGIVALSAPYDSDGTWHRISVEVSPVQWAIVVDGVKRATREVAGPIVPAWGGWVSLGSLQASLRLRNIRWTSLEEHRGAPEALLLGKIPDAAGREVVNATAKRPSDRHVEGESREFRMRVNDLRRPGERNPAPALSRFAEFASDGVEEGMYISLPVDEGYDGPGAQRNIAFAEAVRQIEPEASIFHTFGAMRAGGRRLSPTERLAFLERFAPYVDIFSVRPSVYFAHREFFDDDKRRVSMYIHDVNIVERDDALLLGRNFFWNLDELGIEMTTFWNTTLWFQPEKAGRPGRRIVDTPDGFAVTKRNPSGLGAGMIFYPGKHGLLPSLRSHAWRDGLEDSELLLMLRRFVDEEYGADEPPQLNSARDLLRRHQRIFADESGLADATNSRGVDLRGLRREIGALLSSANTKGSD